MFSNNEYVLFKIDKYAGARDMPSLKKFTEKMKLAEADVDATEEKIPDKQEVEKV